MLRAGTVRRVVVALADLRATTDADFLVDDRLVEHGTRADHRVVHDDTVAHDRPALDHDAGEQDGVRDLALHRATVRDQTASDPRTRLDANRGPVSGLRVHDPIGVGEIQRRLRLHELEVRAIVRIERADVLPVAREPIREHPVPARDQSRQDVLAEVVRGRRDGGVLDQPADERVAVEEVDAHGSQPRGDGAFRLLLERGHAAVRFGLEDAELVDLVHGHLGDGDGEARGVPAVERVEDVVVHLVDVVTRQDEHLGRAATLQVDDVLVDRVGRALVPVARGVPRRRLQQLDATARAVEIPRTAKPDVLIERGRPVLREHADIEDAGVDAVREREVDDPILAAERHRWLRTALREQAQPTADAAGQDECIAPAHRISSNQRRFGTLAPAASRPPGRSS